MDVTIVAKWGEERERERGRREEEGGKRNERERGRREEEGNERERRRGWKEGEGGKGKGIKEKGEDQNILYLHQSPI